MLRGLNHILILFFLAACTQAPTPPTLGRNSQSGGRKILSGSLGPDDYREIFHSINRDGKLSGLEAYFERPTNDELSRFGHVISRRFYEERDLLELLTRRIEKKSFEKRLGLLPHRELLRAILDAHEFPPLMKEIREAWSPSFSLPMQSIHTEWLRYPESSNEPSSGEKLTQDFQKFLSSPLREDAQKAWSLFREHRGGASLLSALFDLKKKNGVGAFQGLGRGLSSLLPSDPSKPNELQKLLELIHAADRPSDGIFESISRKFKSEPDLIHEIANRFKPMVTNAARGFAKEALSESRLREFWKNVPKRGREFTEVFIALRIALEQVAGPALDLASDPEGFLQNLRLYSNAFALTKWIETVATLNGKKEEAFWELLVKTPALTLDLRSPEMQKEMADIGLQDFVAFLEKAKDVPLGNFQYDFPAITTPIPLREALNQAMASAANTRPFADPTSFIRALIYPLTRPDGKTIFGFADLESENLMDSINRLVSGLRFSTWRNLKRTLFEDMDLLQLDNPTFDTRKLILGFYPDDSMKDRVASLLDRVPSLYAFDREYKNLPSPFYSYHTLLRHTSPEDIPAITSLFSFLGKSRFATPDFPYLMDWMREGVPLGQTANSLSVLGTQSREAFLRPLGEIEPEEFLSLLSRLVQDHPKAFSNLAQALIEGRFWDQWPSLEEAELEWIQEFIRSNDLQTTWDFLHRYASRENCLQLLAELKRLTSNGYLKEAVHLLWQFQNESLRHFAEVWLEWDRSGEWNNFLNRMEELLQ